MKTTLGKARALYNTEFQRTHADSGVFFVEDIFKNVQLYTFYNKLCIQYTVTKKEVKRGAEIWLLFN